MMRILIAACSVALLTLSPASATEEDHQRAVAQFRRGADAVRPCERFIDVQSRYYDCANYAEWGAPGTTQSVPIAYALGVKHQKFLAYARNASVLASIEAQGINDDLKKLKVKSVQIYCNFFLVDCGEFSKFWSRMPQEARIDKKVWVPLQ